MSKDKNKEKPDSGRGNDDSGKKGWINEGQSDYDKIRKGAEITIRPEKPKEDSSEKK